MPDIPLDLPLASSSDAHSPRSKAAVTPFVEGTVGTAGGAIRLGSRGLRRLSDNLSDRDRSVLASIEQLKLLTTRHLEHLHYQDSATPLTAARKSRRTLQRLEKLGLVRRLDRQIGGLHAGSAAFVYATTDRGRRALELPGGRRRSSEPSLPFLDHTLAIADLYVELQLLHDPTDPESAELLDVQAEPACWRTYSTLGGGREVLRPDLYVALGLGADELRWFIEVDRGSEHRPALVRKCRAYQTYYETGVEQARDGIFPRVAWVVPDAARAELLRTAIATDPQLTPGLFEAVVQADAARALVTT